MNEVPDGIAVEDERSYRSDICIDCGSPGECCDCSPSEDGDED